MSDDEFRHDSDDDGFNPLAEAMGLSAESVAANTRAEELGLATQPKRAAAIQPNATSSAAAAFDDNNLSSFARAGGARPAAAAAKPAARDEFDDDVGAVSSMRGGVSVTSSGYIDERDVATIAQAQARTAAAKKMAPQEDEFDQLEDVSSMSLAKPAAAGSAGASKPQFDEFADMLDEATAGGAAVGGRKVLKASKDQKGKEKPDAREEARIRAEAARKAAQEAEEAAKRDAELHGLQNATLAKLGIAPTTILAQYEKDPAAAAASPASASSAQSAQAKARAEQRTLESNDAALLAARGEAQQQKPNVVEALVSAHVAAPSAVVEPEVAAEMQQWGAVNEVREKQQAAAQAEAERAAKAGKSIGIRAPDEIGRDTPITYDAALRSLTQGPTPESAAASVVAASASLDEGAPAPVAVTPGSHAIFLESLRPRITIHDFRDVGVLRAAKYKCFGPPRLASHTLEKERDNVFLMAAMPLDHARSIDHERMLLSLYRGLTGDALAPPTYGNHWQIIGFQAVDPGTDLRGSGMFSLIQLLYFLKTDRSLLLKLFGLANDERQNFPLATLSTNITGMVLQALRQAYKVYGECNRRGSVYELVNELYVAAFYEMYLRWKNGQLTIVDWNDTRTQLEDLVLHQPKQLLAKYKANQNGGESGQAPDNLEFTEIP